MLCDPGCKFFVLLLLHSVPHLEFMFLPAAASSPSKQVRPPAPRKKAKKVLKEAPPLPSLPTSTEGDSDYVERLIDAHPFQPVPKKKGVWSVCLSV